MPDNPNFLSVEQREEISRNKHVYGKEWNYTQELLDSHAEADRREAELREQLADGHENLESLYVQLGGDGKELNDAYLYFECRELIDKMREQLAVADRVIAELRHDLNEQRTLKEHAQDTTEAILQQLAAVDGKKTVQEVSTRVMTADERARLLVINDSVNAWRLRSLSQDDKTHIEKEVSKVIQEATAELMKQLAAKKAQFLDAIARCQNYAIELGEAQGQLKRLREQLAAKDASFTAWMEAANKAGFVFSVGKGGFEVSYEPNLAVEMAVTRAEDAEGSLAGKDAEMAGLRDVLKDRYGVDAPNRLAELKQENDRLRAALLSLRNEAAGFLHHADVYKHGNTNMAVFAGKIAEAEKALAATPPALDQLIEVARKHVITPEEHDKQVRSFAYGNVKISNPDVTREDVDQAVDLLATPPSKEGK